MLVSGLIEHAFFPSNSLTYTITASIRATRTINKTIPPISPPIITAENFELLLLDVSATDRTTNKCDKHLIIILYR